MCDAPHRAEDVNLEGQVQGPLPSALKRPGDCLIEKRHYLIVGYAGNQKARFLAETKDIQFGERAYSSFKPRHDIASRRYV